MAKSRNRSRLADTVANPGPGLFVDERARVSTGRAYCAILRFLRDAAGQKLGVAWRDARPHVRPALREVVRCYWANRDYDQRTTLGDMKSDAQRLRQHLRRSGEIIDALPRPVVHALNLQMSRKLGGGPLVRDHLADFSVAMATLKEASRTIAERKNKKGARISVEKACAALWDMCEAMTGRPFVRQWQTGKTPARLIAARGAREFVGLDALFVQVTLRAVDSEVTVAQIRTGLKQVAAAKAKSG